MAVASDAAQGAAAGSFLGPWGMAAGAGIGGLLGMFAGDSQADAQRRANEQRIALAREALGLLGAGQTRSLLYGEDGLLSMMAPLMQAMVQANTLAGQRASQGAQASLGRAGLGNTGIGTALGSGFSAGATFQNNQLRARMYADAMNAAMGQQRAMAGALTGVPIQAVQGGALQGGIQGAGSILTALSPFYGGGGQPAAQGNQRVGPVDVQGLRDWYRG